MNPRPGLVAWYPGEGNAKDIMGGNDGTIHGGVTFVSGKVGQAFNFNSFDGFVQAASPYAIEPANVSVPAWATPRPSAATAISWPRAPTEILLGPMPWIRPRGTAYSSTGTRRLDFSALRRRI